MELDARDVLAKYIATVSTRQTQFCNESALPYPKALIKTVLKGALERAGDDETARSRIHSLYVALAEFQPMSPAEQLAVTNFDSYVASRGVKQENKGVVAEAGALHTLVANRIALDAEALWRELREMQMLDSGK